nr:unnamed protein product [Callosobruchus analis]
MTGLIDMSGDIFRSLDKKSSTVLVTIDYSAFDKISHKLLIAKLKCFGLDSTAISFFYKITKFNGSFDKPCDTDGRLKAHLAYL